MCRSRFLALRTRNRAVRRNIIRPIMVTSPAPGTHLMPQERAHADEECNAHNERRYQDTQVPDHESASFRSAAPGFLSAWDSLLPLSGQRPQRVVLHLKPEPDQLAFWPIAAPPHRAPADLESPAGLRHPEVRQAGGPGGPDFMPAGQASSGSRLPGRPACRPATSSLPGRPACRAAGLPGCSGERPGSARRMRSASCAPRRYRQSTATAIG
jgi:hypothetical protein